MKIQAVLLVLILVSFSLFHIIFFNVTVSASLTTITVPGDFPTIRAAVEAANPGDTIMVNPGIYYEGMIVSTSNLTLLGKNRTTTIVHGAGFEDIFYVTGSNVKISGFTIKDAGFGVYLWRSNSSTISGNLIINTTLGGIRLEGSEHAQISGNMLGDNDQGIQLKDSHNSRIIENTLFSNTHGIRLEDSDNNTFVRNSLTNNYYGFVLYSSHNNTLAENTVSNNQRGTGLSRSESNIIYHNNFVNNTIQKYNGSPNIWDNGYEGNFWSDYNGTDLDDDGVGDIYLPWEGVDYYPLINRYWSATDINYWSPADINYDLKVDRKDIATVAFSFGSFPGHFRWNPLADITGPMYLVPDSKVDIRDIALIAKNFGKTWAP